MEPKEISERIALELNILSYVRQALEMALVAPIRQSNLSEWIERFTFLGESFSRHITRLFAIEEEDGYMAFIVSCQQPTLGGKVDQLRAEHDEIALDLDQILSLARDGSNCGVDGAAVVRDRLEHLLARLDDHLIRERDLWLDGYMVEIGGEG